jgi:hypothetical protein
MNPNITQNSSHNITTTQHDRDHRRLVENELWKREFKVIYHRRKKESEWGKRAAKKQELKNYSGVNKHNKQQI